MKILEIILEDESKNIYAVGDSLAVGVMQTNGIKGNAEGGIPPKEVLNRINILAKTYNLKGAIVIVGTGVPNGPSQIDLVNNQIKALKDAGAIPVILGTGPGGNVPRKDGGFNKIDLTGLNEKLERICSTNQVKFTGPLIKIDPSMAKGDGVHMGPAGYKQVYNMVKAGQLGAVGTGNKEESEPLVKIEMPTSDRGPACADIQKVLKADGYGELLGPFGNGGVDGIIGKYTRNAIKTFQEKNKLERIDGNPSAETVGALNALLNSKYKDKLTKSTEKDVVLGQAPGEKWHGSIVGKQKSGTNFVDKNTIRSYLETKGFDKNQIAGWLANIAQECSFNFGVYTPNDVNGPGGGCFGFHDTFDGKVHNFTDMVKACGGENAWQSNWQGQLNYALSTPAGQQYKAQKFPTPAKASEWWVRNYERPGQIELRVAQRNNLATQFA